jgi:hypothetical protein
MSAESELETLRAMIKLFCRYNHAQDQLCDSCSELLTYAESRLDNCPLRNDKPTCQACHIHCYSPAMRRRITDVMKFSGPRMLLHHPVMALKHLAKMKKSGSASTHK